MALDPSVPLSALRQGQPQQGPADWLQNAYSLQGLMQQNKARDLQLQQAQQAQSEQMKMQQAAQGGGSPEEIADRIYRINPIEGAKLKKALYDAQSSDTEARTKAFDFMTKRNDQWKQRLGTVLFAPPEQRQQVYLQTMTEAVKDGLVDPQTLPAQFDPQWAQAKALETLQFDKQLEEHRKQFAEGTQRAKAPFELQKSIAEAQKAQQEAAGTQPIQPYQQAQLAATEQNRAATNALTEQQRIETERNHRAMEAAARLRAQNTAATTSSDDVKDAAAGIMDGSIPPDMTGFYRNKLPLIAELRRQGFDLTTAEKDWKAVQRHLSTLNGAQQERLRQAISFTYDSLDNIDSLYKEWKQVAGASGFKVLNKANLAASKQVPGRAGAVATSLEAQIGDLTSELGTVYKGGNSSTDESLRLAGKNLEANWNEETFTKAMQNIKTNLRIRRNSINNSQPAGVSPNSQYVTPPPQQQQAPPASNQQRLTATNPSTGEKIESTDGGQTWRKIQ